MAATTSAQSPVSKKLAIVCTMAMAASVFAGDDMPTARTSAYQAGGELSSASDADALAQIPELIKMCEEFNAFFDRFYAETLQGLVSESLLARHPFTTVGVIYSRALAEIKDLRGTGQLGPHGDRLIMVLAESRHKADRNANLIRQMMVEPKSYVSPIDRQGLVALAKLGRESATSFAS